MKKSTKKNDKTIFIAAAIMFACAIGLFVGAFARFQTVVGGSATLKTADWSFMVNGGTSDFSVNLADGTAYNLVEVDGEKRIQPGSYGVFALVLSAVGSDVDVTYNANFGGLSGDKVPANLALYSDDQYTKPLANVSGDVITAGQQKTVNIYWKWLYTETDETEFAGQTLTLPVTVTGYQVDPNA